MSSPVIMICDDNKAVHESLSSYLEADGFQVVNVYDGESALKRLESQHVDLLLLDIMLPHMFGTEVCAKIREKSDLPIIMLSARGDEYDRVTGLQVGADDYIAKPYSNREVVARVRAVLRRTMTVEPSVLTVAELSVNPDAYEVSVSGEKISMTRKEVEILSYLARNPGRVLSREQILNTVWGYEYYGDTRAVDTQIKRMRQKLPSEGVHFAVRSIYGVGYKLEVWE